MPAGSEAVALAKKPPRDSKHKEGLKGIDIGNDIRSASGPSTPQAPTHFEEYRDDEAEDLTAASTPAEPVAVASSDVLVRRRQRSDGGCIME
jgi:hypothetical protein